MTLFEAGAASADSAPAPVPFDPTRRVAEGITVLEASAGTGKTHTVASLVVAEVAEGRPLDDLLVVTFTRKATGTLRERVWQRLAEAAAALAPSGGAPVTGDPVLAHLADAPAATVAARHANLLRAVAEFDAATIATTHGFCQQVLASLGVAGDAERDLEVVDSVRDLVDEAVDDLFVRRFHRGGQVLFTRDEAMAIAAAVIANPDADLAPVDDNEADRLRRRFATTLRDRIDEQKRRGRLLTYDDLLTRLADSIADPVRGGVVADRLRRRYSMAIVDEFQDTDTVQWRILRDAFGSPPCRLVLVGDPKQAVYAFRGGDVHAYLQATRGASNRRSLDVSWRSDQPLLDALDALFDGAELGDPTIVCRPLRARPGAEGRRLGGPDGSDPGAPLTVRILDRSSGFVERTPTGLAKKQAALARVAIDVAAEARRMLGGGLRLVERDTAGHDVGERPLRAGDIAVLVRRHREAEQVRAALTAAGVPAVVHGGAGVLETPAARSWLDLLRALETPASVVRVRSVVLGPFFGWDTVRLAGAADEEWEDVDEQIHDWAATLRSGGVAGLLRRIEVTGALTARLLGTAGGERTLSDLRHVAELLDAAQGGQPSPVAVLLAWLAEHLDADTGGDLEGGRRRLESDADAVAVHTIHGAKGLEFPVVLVPSLWTSPWVPDGTVPVFHSAGGERLVGVGASGRMHREQVEAARRERNEEELRLLYVALTRARHRVVAWWVTASDARTSPLSRMLLGRVAGSPTVAPELSRSPDEGAIRGRVAELGARCGAAVAVEDVGLAGGAVPPGPTPDPAALDVARIGRGVDTRWARTSYSALTAAAHDAGPPPVPGAPASPSPSGARDVVDVVEAAEQVTVDEPASGHLEPVAPGGPPDGHPLAVGVPLADLPGGARVGTMVHDVLEHTDFAATDLAAALGAAAAAAGAQRLVDDRVEVLVAGLGAALRTPLGPSLGDLRLCDVGPGDRLDELSFDLPLAGGETPTGWVTMDAVADVFERLLPVTDPLAGYHQRLRDPVLATEVRGFLTGSIDLVVRDGGRYVVVDYKTNRLAAAGEPLTAWHFRPAALATAMADAHYPLQAALYAVALHRYLRWRLPGYDPASHLGGVAYLFLRGMAGPDAPRDGDEPCGVFAWHPPAAFVLGLSDVLDRGAA